MSVRLRAILAASLVLSCVAAWYVMHRPLPLARAAAIGARLELAAGEVQVTRDGRAETTSSGMPLTDGASIRTGKGSRALLRLLGGASAFLGEDTRVTLHGAGLTLANGHVFLDVPPLSEPVIHDLGVATVAITNAGLSLQRNADAVEVYVARGLAVVASKQARREVASGERATLAHDALAVEPVALWRDWTGGMADRGLLTSALHSGSGAIYAVDRSGASGVQAHELSVRKQSVRARIADGVAETEVDQTFWNAGDHALEGYYWFSVPSQAIVTGFALETNGVLVEGEVVERKEALAQYEAAVQRANDPALLEWISDRTYRARIYPIPAVGTRRVVLRYIEPVALGDDRIRWVYPMTQSESDDAVIDELSLSVELGALGKEATISTLADARVENGGERVTLRRSVYSPRADFQLELVPKRALAPLRVTRFATGNDQADFVMARWVPDVAWQNQKPAPADVVLAVDVSAGGDDSDRALEAAVAEAALRNLAAGDRFALMTTDIVPRVIYPDQGLAPADDAHVAAALERLAASASGGATDLGAMFEPGLSRLHGSEQAALVYIGDGRATSGELAGAALVERLRRSLEGARARFFSVGVGDGANHALLERLSSIGGGAHFRVDDTTETVPRALQLTAAVKTPTITDLSLDLGVGLDEPLSNVSGKLARGQELILLARTHHELPATATIHGRLGGKPFQTVYPIELESGAATPLVPRLWAAELVRRQIGRAASPEQARSRIISLALEYGLVTPYSSILALDSEDAYRQLGIERRDRPWDRLHEAQASLEPSSPLSTVLGIALAPFTLLSGCNQADATKPASPAQSTRADRIPEADLGLQLARRTKEAMAAPEPPPAAPATAAASEPTYAPNAEKVAAKSEGQLDGLLYGALGSTAGAHGDAGEGQLGRHDARQARPSARVAKLDRGYVANERAGVSRDEPREPAEAAQTAQPQAHEVLGICSDAAARSLADRELLWQRRLRSARTIYDALAQYEAARAACELQSAHDLRVFISLLPPFASNAEAAQAMFARFAGDTKSLTYLARLTLRRTLDPYVAALARRRTGGATIDWARLDLELAALPDDAARLARLRALQLGAPAELELELRIVKLLLRTGRQAEALPAIARLRARGLFSPSLLRDLGDVQVAAGLRDDALRTYTEILEFAPDSAAARELVGDLLLEHGWYEVAYRQFQTLVERTPESATAQIRMALAAAGTGRSDEALRILRAVAESEGESGATDSRLHARLLASALIARLLADPHTDAGNVAALERKLEQLQVLEAPGKLYLLTWDALDESLGLGTTSGDLIDAADVGLVALGAADATLETLRAQVMLRSQHESLAPLHFKLHELSFDGKRFSVKVLDGQLG